VPIENVSDTARWVAVYRAMESERPDALFRDPYARRLAGERGERIVAELPRARAAAWPMITRTAVFDEIILDLVSRPDGADTVVNLAAGLDVRAWRLPLPPALRWVDVDLPAILEYKRGVIGDAAPRCRYEAVAADLTDGAARDALFARLAAESRRALVVSEGLLIYLTAEQVGALAASLHAAPSFRWWLFDLSNPLLLRLMKRTWGERTDEGNASFLFAPAEGPEFFRPFGWRMSRFRSGMEEARRLGREMRFGWFWRFVNRLLPAKRRENVRRMFGFVLLERDDSGR
jgi:methyltransferase (TIGR00027 family)